MKKENWFGGDGSWDIPTEDIKLPGNAIIVDGKWDLTQKGRDSFRITGVNKDTEDMYAPFAKTQRGFSGHFYEMSRKEVLHFLSTGELLAILP